jgi:predicted SprT family Zn-dependent metalloprotease
MKLRRVGVVTKKEGKMMLAAMRKDTEDFITKMRQHRVEREYHPSCPACGKVDHQYELRRWPSSIHYQCGACQATYSIRREANNK